MIILISSEFFRYSDFEKKLKIPSNSEVLWFNQQFRDPEKCNHN